MTKHGALKSTLIVTSDELKVNGGRWRLQSGPAIRVRGYTADTIGDRKVIGGDALPIYVLAETDARVNGGQWLLKGGQPIPITDVIGTARGVIQGNAIPVWPVDDDGNYDPSFLFTPDQVAGLILWLEADAITGLNDGDPVANWEDLSGNGNDALQGVGADQPLYRTSIINGNPVVRLDGAGDFLETLAFAAPLVQPNTIFTAFNMKNPENDVANVFDGLAAGARHALFTGVGDAPDSIRMFSGVNLIVGDATKNAWHLRTTFYNTVASEFRLDGALINSGNTGVNNLTGLQIGGFGVAGNFDGDFYAVLIYDNGLSDADRQSVESYLLGKIGL